MNFLILSNRHYLLPLANRLTKEGHDTQVLMYHSSKGKQYEQAYEGVIELAGHRSNNKDWQAKLAALKEMAQEGECIVVTDSWQASQEFSQAQVLFPMGSLKLTPQPTDSVRLGAWFNGQDFEAEHLMVCELGPWAGGVGQQSVLGGLTVVRLSQHDRTLLPDLTAQAEDLSERNFRGLVQWSLDGTSGELKLGSERALGWQPLHGHAFMNEMDNLGDVMGGGSEAWLPTRFSCVLPVSQPPWPNHPAKFERGYNGPVHLPQEAHGHVLWHDVRVDTEAREVMALGLDGLVGVVRAGFNSFELARETALGVARSMDFPDRQYRVDFGANVPGVLGAMEQAFGFSF